jgi:hypothetical protein
MARKVIAVSDDQASAGTQPNNNDTEGKNEDIGERVKKKKGRKSKRLSGLQTYGNQVK